MRTRTKLSFIVKLSLCFALFIWLSVRMAHAQSETTQSCPLWIATTTGFMCNTDKKLWVAELPCRRFEVFVGDKNRFGQHAIALECAS